MKKEIFIGIIVIVGLILGGILTFGLTGNSVGDDTQEQVQDSESLVPAPGFEDIPEMIVNAGSGSEGPTTFTVEITSSGFSPKTLEINSGDTIIWINRDSESRWPASAVHPTHTAYPEQGGCIGSKFDSCKGISNGESYSFTFDEEGTWKYHDHLRASLTGTIIVN